MDTITQKSLKRFGDALKAQGKSASTVESYSRDARQFLSYLSSISVPENEADPNTLKAYINQRATDQCETENSIRRSIIGIRQYFRHLADSKIGSMSPFDDSPIPQRIEIAPDSEAIRAISDALTTTRPDPTTLKEARDRLIFCLLGIEGIKSSEIVDLKWANTLITETHSSVKIEGSRSRLIELCDHSRTCLETYIQFLEQEFGPDSIYRHSSSYVLLAFRGRDFKNVIPHMTRHGLKFLLYEFGSVLKIDHLNAETLRHHAVTHMISNGLGPEEIMRKLGLKRLGNIKKHFNTKPLC